MNSTEERFGRLRLLSHEWEPTPFTYPDLSQWLPQCDLEQVETLYVLGICGGAPYRAMRLWLLANNQRTLVLLDRDPGAIAALFVQNHPLLADPQLDLEWLDSNETIQRLAERHPVRRIEVIASPGYDVKQLRLQLLRKTTLTYAIHLDRLEADRHFGNFIRNVPRLKGAFYANGLKGAFQGETAIVCGAGPSLQQAIPQLKELEGRALIIGCGSAIAALSSEGIDPHFGIAVDPNPDEYRRFVNACAFEMPLLTSTRLYPGVYETCNGPFGHLRSGVGGACEIWLEEELGLLDPLMGEHLSDESMSVTMIALAFAQMIGCSTILLAGMDLAYTNQQRYAPGICSEPMQWSEIEAKKNASDQILRRKDKQGRIIKTAVRWAMESSAISHYAKKHPEICWINTTEGGLPIRNVPFLSLPEAIKAYCARQSDLRGRIAREIALHPMPDPSAKLQDLLASLERLILHLEILAGERKGSKALAEVEYKEELAASLLFYDIERLWEIEKPVDKWAFFLSLARKHLDKKI